jgi:hypothetical protein
MQRIRFEFNVRVDPKLVTKEFSSELRDKLKTISGVEEVSGPWFTFEIFIVRPQAEVGKAISDEIRQILVSTFGVNKVTELGWSRY